MKHLSGNAARVCALLLAALCLMVARPAGADATGYLHFSVKDVDSEKALARATITLHDSAKAHADITLTTDAQGSASSPALATRTWQVVTDADAYQPDTRSVTVADGTTEVEVLLSPEKEKVIKVTAERSNNLVGTASSASQGTVGARQIAATPHLRTGEILEAVPGLVVTQHSGSGKANQYFLRGFNLDHGTDLATFVDGMPINMPTHAHGQGYTDLNFLIPELVSGIAYSKGSYHADQGDFSSAGSVYVSLFNHLQSNSAEVSSGTFGYRRLVLTGSPRITQGNLVYGLELFHNDDSYVHGDNYHKVTGLVRYGQGDEKNGFTVTGMGYNGKWNSSDQIPERAVTEGIITRFGAIDPTDGGNSYRYSLSGQYQHGNANAETRANAYLIDYKMNLFSDFTYFLDHPETDPPGQQGDQFEQADQRTVAGFAASHDWKSAVANAPVENIAGIQFRNDNITPIGLYQTEAKQVFAITRQDRVTETSFAPYYENRAKWTPTFRTIAGLRYDDYHADVNSSIPVNSGRTHSSIGSPKLGFIFGPWRETEYYLNLAEGFHSNDMRGSTITIDPKSLLPVSRVTPLVRAKEAEVGLRTAIVPHLQSTFALWYLHLDSELVFDGDAGTTVPSRPSERTGVEFTNFYTPTRYLTINADYGFSKARFTDSDPVGNHIPEAIEGVGDVGVAYEPASGAFGSIRLRYFGPRALIEDNSVRSGPSTLVNSQVGYKFVAGMRLFCEVFNMFNVAVDDIDYYYTSRLPGEPAAGVNDIHFHPTEARSVRLGIIYNY